MIGAVITSMCRLDCDAKQKWTVAITEGYNVRLEKLGFSQDRINEFIKGKYLYLPAGLLLTSTFISIAIYIFGQNWFFTILYNNYMGFGYFAYVGVLFGSKAMNISLDYRRGGFI